jgi:predicted ATP-grasp superfamily ATP-dependent carboligase
VRIFLSEYLTSGAFAGDSSEKVALAVEGAAMLRALAADAAAVPGWRVGVIWDAELEPFGVPLVEVHLTRSPRHEGELFRRLAAEADATIVIAPEFDGLLEERCRIVTAVGGRFVGPTPEAIALCGDKLALAERLATHGVPTIETRRCDFRKLATALSDAPPQGFIVKPRHGAGSIGLFRVRNRDELGRAEAAYAAGPLCGGPIVQPFIAGDPLSGVGIVSPEGIELFPIARQRITGDDRPHYACGIIPARIDAAGAVADLARRAFAAVPGLSGYVGLDLILSEDGVPIAVEINPRLTSSYLGYRRLATENLAERIVAPKAIRPPAHWRQGWVEFQPDGKVKLSDAR